MLIHCRSYCLRCASCRYVRFRNATESDSVGSSVYDGVLTDQLSILSTYA
jgi:hypothetical protein